jgi:hypothetical protein
MAPLNFLEGPKKLAMNNKSDGVEGRLCAFQGIRNYNHFQAADGDASLAMF